MPAGAEELYQQMLIDLKRIRGQGLPELDELELCFATCNEAKQKLERWLSGTEFENARSEIHFYKNLLPVFESEIEYLKKIYHAIIFRPAETNAQKLFFENELNKLDQFYLDNLNFIGYFRNGCTDRDEEFFLIPNLQSPQKKFVQVIALLKAFERFRLYINLKLERLDE